MIASRCHCRCTNRGTSLSKPVPLLYAMLTGIIVLACYLPPAHAQNSHNSTSNRIDPVLTKKVLQAIDGFKGEAGVYVRHLKSGKTVMIRADELFPTASMIKVPIMLTAFQKIEEGKLDYHGEQTYRDSLLYAGEDILGSFKEGEKIKLSKVIMLMITTSDNTASLWCQKLVGTGTAINEWLQAHGFSQTRVNSRTPGREADREKFGWGQTTPREMAELLVMIREGRAVSPDASEEMYRTLTRIYWNGEALSQIPPFIPRPLRIIRHAGHGPWDDTAWAILALTKMDWNNDALYDPLPVTLAYAKVLSRVVKRISRLGSRPYQFRFFM